MLVTLIPFFDNEMKVYAYSVFSQKNNYLLNPSFLGSGENDGAAYINGLDLLNEIGIETLTMNKDVFIPINNISIFTNIEEQCTISKKNLVLLIDHTIPTTEQYISRS